MHAISLDVGAMTTAKPVGTYITHVSKPLLQLQLQTSEPFLLGTPFADCITAAGINEVTVVHSSFNSGQHW